VPVRRVSDAGSESAEAAVLNEAPVAAELDAVVDAAQRISLDAATAAPPRAEAAAPEQQQRCCRVLLVGACMLVCLNVCGAG
jgi:hypothetical protein